MAGNEKPASFIRIQNISKHFGDFIAVDNVSLDIGQGELFSILGGSGCGKTTLLRMLAGFETPTSGNIEIDGVDITEQPPYERPVNMMFQSYAVFPHMNVEKNIAYGLRKDRVANSEIARRVNDMLELVQLADSKVLLLDEPLAALDKKLREQTQFELMNIQDELGITFVVVTHDQEEAMTLSTRIAVMEKGRFLQVGEPKEIYEYPKSRFVANFVGTINTFEGNVSRIEDEATIVDCAELGGGIATLPGDDVSVGQAVCVAVRPEKIFISLDEPEQDGFKAQGVVDDLGYLGNRSLYRIRLASGGMIQVSRQNQRRSSKRFVEWDDKVWVTWRPRSAVLLVD
jgi:putrescine transport system ATP-binding protein